VDWELLEFIEKLEPFGSQNSAPVFAAQNVQLMDYRKVGKDRRHLKLTLESDMHRFDGIAFRQGDLADGLGRMVDVAFKLERNEYLGYESLQLNVQDIRSSDISNKGS
jgi:single-stranded-DNA-specific exonuclease